MGAPVALAVDVALVAVDVAVDVAAAVAADVGGVAAKASAVVAQPVVSTRRRLPSCRRFHIL
jgi:hypothetical protein